MRTTAILAGFAGLGLSSVIPVAAMAAGNDSDLHYTYIQLNGIARDIKPVGNRSVVNGQTFVDKFDDGTGGEISGSVAVLPKYFVFGDYSNTTSDVSYSSSTTFPLPANTRIKRFDVGLGTNRPITDRLDFLARVAYSDVDYGSFKVGSSGIVLGNGGGLSGLADQIENQATDDTSDGYLVDVALRAQLTDWLEGTIGARHFDIGSVETNDAIGSLLFEVSQKWGIDLGVDTGDDISTYRLGVRFTPGG